MNGVKPILVTGATGYVSGRLIPSLLADGYKVKAITRIIPQDLISCSEAIRRAADSSPTKSKGWKRTSRLES